MKIGYVVQGSTDQAFLYGLKERWCNHVALESLGFRGSELRLRMYTKICNAGQLKGCDAIIILTDSDDNDLNTVYKAEKAHLDADVEYYVILGVAVRNIECWICANPEYIAKKAKNYPDDINSLRADDPKSAFQSAIGITTYDKKEREIRCLVRDYPSLKPMLEKTSFKRFYDEIRGFALRNRCEIPNEWEK